MIWTPLKLKSFALWSTLSREYKDKPKSGAKHVQITFIKGLAFKICRELLNNIKITSNLTTKWAKGMDRPLIKKIYRWQIGIWRDDQIICLKVVQMNLFTKQSHRSRKQFYGYQWESQSVSQFNRSVMSNYLWPPWTSACQTSLSIINSQSMLKLISIK